MKISIDKDANHLNNNRQTKTTATDWFVYDSINCYHHQTTKNTFCSHAPFNNKVNLCIELRHNKQTQ